MQEITYSIITGDGNASHQRNRELSMPLTFLEGQSHLKNMRTKRQNSNRAT